MTRSLLVRFTAIIFLEDLLAGLFEFSLYLFLR